MTDLAHDLFQPTARAIGVGQLEFSWMVLDERLSSLTEAEFGWEPAPGALSVVPRGRERTARTRGVGEWVQEWPAEADDGGTRTISWLVAHLTEVYFDRWEWTFGDHRRRAETDLAYTGDLHPALALLREWAGRWRTSVAALDDEQFFAVGLSRAGEIDQVAPFGHVVAHLNRELIHHGSEISTLADLYRARST